MARYALESADTRWQRFVSVRLAFFAQALLMLTDEPNLPLDENVISNCLDLKLRDILFVYNKKHGTEERLPKRELPLPATDRKEAESDQLKRPDFSCSFVNPHAITSAESEVSFHVECKIIGASSSSGWNYNDHYVVDGMARYDLGTHKYGRYVEDGLMIGFLYGKKAIDVEVDVNATIKAKLHYYPALKVMNSKKGSYEGRQEIVRRSVLPSKFTLHHKWIELGLSPIKH